MKIRIEVQYDALKDDGEETANLFVTIILLALEQCGEVKPLPEYEIGTQGYMMG